MSHSDLKYEVLIKAHPTHVYRAFTNATSLREWLSDGATVDPKPGGRMVVWWNDGYVSAGQYEELEVDQRVAFTWKGRTEPAETHVLVALTPHKGGVTLTLIHSRLGEGEAWDQPRAEFKRAWEFSLENLTSVLETGKDLRIFRRPMLGIMVSDFNAEIAAAHGIPVTAGVRLDDTVEGMGARAAGLQKDDVLISMAGKDVKGFDDLRMSLQGHQAGDSIEVEFYRGAQKIKLHMTLSGRPEPEITWNAALLAERIAEIYAQMDQELWSAIEGISEKAASTQPDPNEWSVNEILAHLIINERFNPPFIAELIDGQESWQDGFTSNIHAPLDAILEVYPSKQALFEELKRCEAETVAIVRALPAEFLERKGSYYRMADQLLSFRYHTRAHIPQIQAAGASAQNK